MGQVATWTPLTVDTLPSQQLRNRALLLLLLQHVGPVTRLLMFTWVAIITTCSNVAALLDMLCVHPPRRCGTAAEFTWLTCAVWHMGVPDRLQELT